MPVVTVTAEAACRHGTHAAGANRFSPGPAPEALLQAQFPTPHLPGNARPNGKSAVISESGQEIVLLAHWHRRVR